MASEVIERLIKIDASQGAESMRALSEVVKDAKTEVANYEKQVRETGHSSKEYEQALADLKTAQGKYAEATRIAVANNENAKGSFNDLNGQLRILKEQWKKTADETERGVLTAQINAVKEQINGMNESIGNFQHNVGNYTSHWKGLGDQMDKMKAVWDANRKGATDLSSGIDLVGKSSKALATGNPLLSIMTILLPLIVKVSNAVKENSTLMDALKEAMKALEPVTNLFEKAVEFLANSLAKVVGHLTNFLKRIKLIKDEAPEVNAPLEETTEVVSKLATASKNAGEALDELAEGLKRIREELAESAELMDADEGVWAEGLDSAMEGLNTRLKSFEEANKTAREEYLASLAKDVAETAEAEIEADTKVFNNRQRIMEWSIEKQADFANETIATSSAILDSLSALMESMSQGDDKRAKKSKALAIASTIISTLKGATDAYMESVKTYGVPAGLALGVANAGIVTALGMANVNKIRSTDMSGNAGGAGVSLTATAPTAVVSAPAVVNQSPTTRYITGASQETIAGQILEKQSQPVVLVWSEAEAMAKYGDARRAETSFR